MCHPFQKINPKQRETKILVGTGWLLPPSPHTPSGLEKDTPTLSPVHI